MSTYFNNTDPAHAPRAIIVDDPKRPRKQRPAWLRKAILPAAALLVGIGVGTAGGGDNQPAAAPEPVPAPTVTQTVETPGPTVTTEVKVPGPEVEVAPPVCLLALDYADQGFTISGKVLTALQAGISSGDFSAADAGNAELSALAPKYNTAKTQCRAAAK